MPLVVPRRAAGAVSLFQMMVSLCFNSSLLGSRQWVLSQPRGQRCTQSTRIMSCSLHVCSSLLSLPCVWRPGTSVAQVTWGSNWWGQDIHGDPGIWVAHGDVPREKGSWRRSYLVLIEICMHMLCMWACTSLWQPGPDASIKISSGSDPIP